MGGTKLGGINASKTNKSKYGKDFYRNIGAVGGKNGNTGGFASSKVGKDGLTGRQRAAIVGSEGGRNGKRGLAIRNRVVNTAIDNSDVLEG